MQRRPDRDAAGTLCVLTVARSLCGSCVGNVTTAVAFRGKDDLLKRTPLPHSARIVPFMEQPGFF
jgi:hypothetical protein